MKQVGIIDGVIETLGFYDRMAKRKFTPSESKPLVKDADGSAPCGTFSYSSVVGMLPYLSDHSRPYIAYEVNCCARYMFFRKKIHETSLKRIYHYLKATRYKGLILNPSSDFPGMYGREIPTDPTCVKRRTGFVITFSDYPVYWESKFQTKTEL